MMVMEPNGLLKGVNVCARRQVTLLVGSFDLKRGVIVAIGDYTPKGVTLTHF